MCAPTRRSKYGWEKLWTHAKVRCRTSPCAHVTCPRRRSRDEPVVCYYRGRPRVNPAMSGGEGMKDDRNVFDLSLFATKSGEETSIAWSKLKSVHGRKGAEGCSYELTELAPMSLETSPVLTRNRCWVYDFRRTLDQVINLAPTGF